MKLLEADSHELQAKLAAYLAQDSRYNAVFAYTKQRFQTASQLPAHNWAHSYRDTLNAMVIGEAEQADMTIVLPAITMHDIGFLYGATGKTHSAVGAARLGDYLRESNVVYPEEQLHKIADCIRTHKGSMHNEQPGSLEAKVVADADLLDKFGPVGVYQHIRTFTEFNQPLEVTLERGQDILKLTLETDTGRRLAERGRQFVVDFFQTLAEAYQPYTTHSNA